MDFSVFKKLTIGGVELKQLFINGIQVWKAITFKNWVPLSTDTDGSIFNGTGYKENVRLSSSGGISGSAQNGSVTTGFIPWYGDTTYLRMKGVEWLNGNVSGTANHYYINCYDGSKKFLDYLAAAEYRDGNFNHIVTVSRDANGIETIKFSETYGTTNAKLQHFRNASYIRITAVGKGANMIVTLNEEIT
jgi:hypothetical protein